MVRFAWETGAKCLYPNLPGDLSLTANYREKGENYGRTMGADSVLLRENHFLTGKNTFRKNRGENETDDKFNNSDGSEYSKKDKSRGGKNVKYSNENEKTFDDIDLESLKSSLEYFPSYAVLAQSQYDFNLRRAGSVYFIEIVFILLKLC